ncbi:hypothetical protein EDC30_102289 [Paucimonas lemoignei]|uniref:Uncharacterized protein n=1 Tax=Paucimonas lemoignei TaxID=29443 RepID=A0A4V2UJ38_PAULE|nr:hypothetical protein [Paucimonas lemoignei]TCS38550.1 hypothetical protein EDC30_102289 [Paucimonas lemoignei]
MDHTQSMLSSSSLSKFILSKPVIAVENSAWSMGDQAYELGDTFESGVAKAAKAGIRPGSNEYAAFITAFSRRLRSRQVAPGKQNLS